MIRRWLAPTIALAIATVCLLTPREAEAALSNVALVASNNQVGTSGVTVTLSFQVGLPDSAVVVTLPAGMSGLGTANTSVTTSSDGTTYSAPALAAANPKLLSANGRSVAVNLLTPMSPATWVTATITGLTNPGSVGAHTVVAAGKVAPAGQADVDAGTVDESANVTYNVVAVASNGISSSVGVAPTLSFSVGASSRSWSLDPAGASSSTSQTETLTVVTNATSYVIQAATSGHLVRAGTDGSNVRDRIEHDGPAEGPHFAYRVTPPAGDDPGGAFATTVRPWSTSFQNLVSGWSASGLTNGETTTITYDVKIDYTKTPGPYTGSVTYRVVPSY